MLDLHVFFSIKSAAVQLAVARIPNIYGEIVPSDSFCSFEGSKLENLKKIEDRTKVLDKDNRIDTRNYT